MTKITKTRKEKHVFTSNLLEKVEANVDKFLRNKNKDEWKVKMEGPTKNKVSGLHSYKATLERKSKTVNNNQPTLMEDISDFFSVNINPFAAMLYGIIAWLLLTVGLEISDKSLPTWIAISFIIEFVIGYISRFLRR